MSSNMSTTTRLTLHDCKSDLRIPVPIDPTPKTLEAYALEAALSPNDLTECYIGSTVFLLLTLTAPTSPKALLPATKTLSDLTVLVISPPTRESIRLSIVRESSWACVGNLLVKGVWVLIRAPPSADDSPTLATTGKQNIVVSIRETTPSSRSSSVWATLDRAGRLFAKSLTLRATRAVMLAMPIQVSCHATCVGGSVDKTILSVIVKNATNDAYVSVVPPYINIASSRVVKELERDPVGTPVQLQGSYEFVPMFDTSTGKDNDEEKKGSLKHEESGASCEDYGLFIPSFNHLLRRAASLGPREVYNFAYRVVQKPLSDAKGDPNEETTDVRMQPDECVQTVVAVAWSCSKTEEEEDIGEEDKNLQREVSAGGLLATGQRGNVAVHMTNVNWRPSSLLGGIIVTVFGPRTARIRETVNLSISVVNQTGEAIEKASVRIQEGEIEYNLMALRTVISIGRIAAGAETNLQLPCLALESGAQGLGKIRVVEEGGDERKVWISESEYKVLVLDMFADEDEEQDEEAAISFLEELVAR